MLYRLLLMKLMLFFFATIFHFFATVFHFFATPPSFFANPPFFAIDFFRMHILYSEATQPIRQHQSCVVLLQSRD
jgi:hypothetical protein